MPISATPVARRDVPVYLEGLGSVAAFYTVTVHSQVDGRLDHVYFQEGQQIHVGDLLVQIDPRPFRIQLQQAQAILARDRANLHANLLALERDQQLRTQHIIAPQDFDNQQSNVGQLRGAIRADEAQIANAQLMLDYARITAPIDGVTGVRLVDPGNLVRASDANGLVVITQIDPIAVFFTLPEDDLPEVNEAMSHGPVTVDVFSRDGVTLLGSGQLALVDNQINETTATIRLKAILHNPARRLWPNQFVKARLLLTVRREALVVPAAAIQRGPNGTFVYVVGPDHRAQPRNVEVIETQNDLAILANAALHEGESVVTDGQAHLRPGALVSVQSAEHEPATGAHPHARAPAPDGGSRPTP